MHQYELVYILQADLDETTINTAAENIEKLLIGNGGEIVKTERWGKRKLAYAIRKMNEGYYVFISFHYDPAKVADLKRTLGYNEQILRYIVVRVA